jgi:putative MFS transporter
MQTATYGIVLWGPTLLVLVLSVSPAQASFMFIFVGLSAFVGRIVFALVSEAIGRKLTGGIVGFGAALFLLLAGILPYDATLAGLSVFYLMIVLAYFFTDGGFALIAGSSDVVNPGATIDALTPGFAYLAAFGILAGLAYVVLGIETRGKSIEEIDDELRVKGRELVPS